MKITNVPSCKLFVRFTGNGYRIEKLVGCLCVEVGPDKFHPGEFLTRDELAALFKDTAFVTIEVLAPHER